VLRRGRDIAFATAVKYDFLTLAVFAFLAISAPTQAAFSVMYRWQLCCRRCNGSKGFVCSVVDQLCADVTVADEWTLRRGRSAVPLTTLRMRFCAAARF
jgi:hypothetical protein